MIAVLALLVFVLSVSMRVPIVFSLIFAVGLFIIGIGDIAQLPLVTQRLGTSLNSFTFLAVPLFLLAGNLLTQSGMAERLMNFAMAFLGRTRAGLAQASVGTNFIMAGMSGSANADTAATGSIFIPMMRKSGYAPGFSAAAIAVPAMIGSIIPPSIIIVIYAGISGVSAGALLLAGIGPGVLLALGMMAWIALYARRHDLPRGQRFALGQAVRVTGDAILALLMPVIILGGLFSGIYTATEGAAVAVAYSFAVGAFIYRTLTPKKVWDAFITTAIMTGAVMFIVGIAGAVSWVLTRQGAAMALSSVLAPFSGQPAILWTLVLGMLLIGGMFLESASLLVLATPFVAPILISTGADPLVVGMAIVMVCMAGGVTPPVGISMFITMKIADASMGEFSRAVWPFLVAILLVIAGIILFPPLVTGIPGALLSG